MQSDKGDLSEDDEESGLYHVTSPEDTDHDSEPYCVSDDTRYLIIVGRVGSFGNESLCAWCIAIAILVYVLCTNRISLH